MVRLLISFLLFAFQNLFSQFEKRNIEYGQVILINNEIVNFKDLVWKNDKAHYTNIDNNTEESLYDASIKSIIEKDLPVENKAEAISNSNLYKPNFPEGIYLTKEEFINKSPSAIKELIKKGLYGLEKPIVSDEEKFCFFYEKNKDKKVKDAFAIVNNGILYFNIKSLLQNRNKTDRSQSSDFPNSFFQVVLGGENYLYGEVVLANAWAKGFSANYGMYGIDDHLKGVVWDFTNKEFNIFKNCQDYNLFIQNKSPNDIQKCTSNQPDIWLVRVAIEKIK